MRKARRRKGSGFTDSKREFFTFGQIFFSDNSDPYSCGRGGVTKQILADADTHGPDLIAEHIASRPGQRPWIWWVLHLGIPIGETFHKGQIEGFTGLPEFEYLARNNHLNSAEQNCFAARLENDNATRNRIQTA